MKLNTPLAMLLLATTLTMAAANVAAQAKTNPLQRKLEQIVFDRIEFEEVSLPTVVRYLKQRAKDLDPEGKGVNIILLPSRDKAEEVPSITMALDEVPLGEIIRYLCMASDYHYKIERHAVIIAPKSRALDQMETRTHRVAPEAVRDAVRESEKK